eukprot:1900006-Prymnesium_polylepis.1
MFKKANAVNNAEAHTARTESRKTGASRADSANNKGGVNGAMQAMGGRKLRGDEINQQLVLYEFVEVLIRIGCARSGARTRTPDLRCCELSESVDLLRTQLLARQPVSRHPQARAAAGAAARLPASDAERGKRATPSQANPSPHESCSSPHTPRHRTGALPL